jgi:spermidine synthase
MGQSYMPWTLIDSTTEDNALLELYRKDGVFMIRANGLELMNGFCHESETALGHLAAALAPPPQPRILLGGLGLGYTAAALVQALGMAASITVAELSVAVIGWFHRHVGPSVLPDIPAGMTIVRADIADLLEAEDRHDLVALDVDNGPEPLVTAKNGALYSNEGLASLYRCLSENGIALLWSGFESAEFVTRAEQAGFRVRCEPFRRARAELSHYVYVLEKHGAATRRWESPAARTLRRAPRFGPWNPA